MKSFRQFISEGPDPDVSWNLFLKRIKGKLGLGTNDNLPKGEAERLKKLFDDQYKKPTTKKGSGISDIEGTDELGPEKRGGDSIKDREKKKRTFDQEKLDQRKLEAQERTKFKKTTKAERAKHIGKPTHISKKHGVKYIPPKDVPKSELTGPNTKGEIVSRRRAKRSIDVGRKPEKISDVKKKIDSIDAYNRRHKKAEYSTSTQAKNRYGDWSTTKYKKGTWYSNITSDGRSATRNPSSPSVDDVKRNIPEPKKRKFRFGDVWNQFSKKKSKPQLGIPKPSVNRTNRLLSPSKAISGLLPSGKKGGAISIAQSTAVVPSPGGKISPSGTQTTAVVPSPGGKISPSRTQTTAVVPSPGGKIIDQREVSKRASQFTKDTNTERIRKLSRGRVKIDYNMPEPKKGEILRSVDNRPKTKTQLSPDTLRSTNPKSDINTTWDKSKASKTFKDMATDSRKKLSSKGPLGRSKEYVKNLTNKISRSLGFKSKVKSTPKVTKVPKNKLFQRLNITRKKGLRSFKGTAPGLYFGLDNYTKQREAGAGRLRSTGGAVTSAAAAGQAWKHIGNVFKSAGSSRASLARGAVTLGLQYFGAKKAAELTQKAYDSTLGPPKTKTKTAVNTKNNKMIPAPFGGSKKKKKLDFGNYSFSFAGDPRLNKKDKK